MDRTEELPTAWRRFTMDGDGIYYERIVSISGLRARIEVGLRRYDEKLKKFAGTIEVVRAYDQHIGGLMTVRDITDDERRQSREQCGRSFYQFGKCPICSDDVGDASVRQDDSSPLHGERDNED